MTVYEQIPRGNAIKPALNAHASNAEGGHHILRTSGGSARIGLPEGGLRRTQLRAAVTIPFTRLNGTIGKGEMVR